MTTPNQIQWGKYTNFEGPYYPGSLPYKLPPNPDFLDKCLAVVTATEGGKYDAINMYDRCIVSVGVIQCCESAPVFAVSSLLGRCMELSPKDLEFAFKEVLPLNTRLKKNQQGAWRFFMDDREVIHQDQQRQLWFGRSSRGTQGSWDAAGKAYAKCTAAMLADIWLYPAFRVVQDAFNKSRLMNFIWPTTKLVLFADSNTDGWVGALKAAFISFAANLPSIADKAFKLATANPAWDTATAPERFGIALQALVFSPGITIYPGRYNKIAPVLRTLFGVDVPLTSEELKVWEAPKVEFSKMELDMLQRYLTLSTNVEQGSGMGLAALDNLKGRE